MKTRLLITSTCAALALIVHPAVHAGALGYTVTDLGTLPGYFSSYARAINAAGEVVGGSQTYNSAGVVIEHAFIWDQAHGMLDIGTLGGPDSEATGVNASGQVAGWSSVASGGPNHAFLFNNGAMTSLGPLNAFANGINSSGQIVGEGPNGPFIWSNTSGFQFFIQGAHFIGGDSAYAINDLGQVVGTITGANSHAFLYDAGGLHDLGTLGGPNSDAYDINNLGQIVGRALNNSNPDGEEHAFLYSAGHMADLGTFPSGHGSTAYGINNLGQVVGDANVPAGSFQAFLYEDGVMRNLNDLIPASSGWTLERAQDINDSGQIAGFGTINGQKHAVRLDPVVVPEPSAGLLSCLGIAVCTLWRREGRS